MEESKLKLVDYEDTWETDLGAWFPGERVVFKGKDIFTEMFECSWMAIWHFSVLKEELNADQVEFWSRLWVIATSYPEPRIWNNRIASLSGSTRSTAYLSIAAGTAASEAVYFGGQAIMAATNFITHTKKQMETGCYSLEQILADHLKGRGVPAGFGRPVIRSDERIPPAIKLAMEYGLDKGHHLRIALEVEQKLFEMGYKQALNIGGLASAIAADQNMTPREFYCTSSAVYLAGIMACYFDASKKPVGTFFPLSTDRIRYHGKSLRKWEKP